MIFVSQLYNTGDVVCSEPLHVAPAPAPDPPLVTVTVVGLDERRALERLTCDLVNKRDRYGLFLLFFLKVGFAA